VSENESPPALGRRRPRPFLSRSPSSPDRVASARVSDIVAASRRSAEIAAIIRAAAEYVVYSFADTPGHRASFFLRRAGEGPRAARLDVVADVERELGALADRFSARASELAGVRVEFELAAEEVGKLSPLVDQVVSVAELGAAGLPPVREEG